MIRLLLVGKTDAQADLLLHALTRSSSPAFDVERASNAWDAQARTAGSAYDALVIDDRLSDTDGETLIGRLRASGVHAPALLLTTADADQTRTATADGLGDGYLPRSEGALGRSLVRAVVDMLERQTLNAELANARADAVQSAAALAALRHDLATPLGVIAGLAQVMLDEGYGLDADGRLCVEDVLEAATTACRHLMPGGGVPEPAAEPAAAPAHAGDTPPRPAQTAGAQMVLIADDDPATRRLVSLTLASDRYTVLQAADGKEAWRLIRDHHPAVAILDWQMPVYSGLELTDVIKSDPQVWGMTVILLTGRTAAADRQAGARARADLYLTKPFSPQELLAAVEQALGIG
jgi:DNA-binding response OmpR family regulator